MALIKCEDCGNEVSSKADCCPKCGCPAPEKVLEKHIEEKIIYDTNINEAIGGGIVYLFVGAIALVVTPYLHVLGIFMLILAKFYIVAGISGILYGLSLIASPYKIPIKSLDFIDRKDTYEIDSGGFSEEQKIDTNEPKCPKCAGGIFKELGNNRHKCILCDTISIIRK